MRCKWYLVFLLLRNGIISGMCLGVLVVETPQKSGALITAQYAAEQGRTLDAVFGSMRKSRTHMPCALVVPHR